MICYLILLEGCKLWRFSLCSFIQPPVNTYLVGPNTVRYPLSEMLGSERVSDFGYFMNWNTYTFIMHTNSQKKNKYKNMIFIWCFLTDVWRQIRASGCAIVSVCCEVGPAHRRGTVSDTSTHDVLGLEKTFGFQRILDFGILVKGSPTAFSSASCSHVILIKENFRIWRRSVVNTQGRDFLVMTCAIKLNSHSLNDLFSDCLLGCLHLLAVRRILIGFLHIVVNYILTVKKYGNCTIILRLLLTNFPLQKIILVELMHKSIAYDSLIIISL
jgi:hypothetical protein